MKRKAHARIKFWTRADETVTSNRRCDRTGRRSGNAGVAVAMDDTSAVVVDASSGAVGDTADVEVDIVVEVDNTHLLLRP